MLAPRVNAAGRMSTPDIATRLLLASDEALGDEARALALQLDGENVRRQEEEAEILAAAKKIVQTDPDDRRALGPGRRRRRLAPRRHRHRRVEAGRCLSSAGDRAVDRRRHRARLVPQHSASSTCSARSSAAPHLLIRFGGHKQAAGLTLEAARIKELRRRSTTSPTKRSAPTT